MKPDRLLIAAVFFLIVVGLFSLYATSFDPLSTQISSENDSFSGFLSTPFARQLLWIFLGLFLAAFVSRLDYRRFYDFSWRFYALGILMLTATLSFGTVIRNVRSWITIGPISVQPSEFAKICLILVLARLLSSGKETKKPLFLLAAGAILTGAMAGLVILQPDMGTAILYFSLLLTLPFAARMPIKHSAWILLAGILGGLHVFLFIGHNRLGWMENHTIASDFINTATVSGTIWGGGLLGVLILLVAARERVCFEEKTATVVTYLAGAGAWMSAFLVLDFIKPYQQLRLITFLSPHLDARGAGYNVIQSAIAVGSGRLWGKGLLSASQSLLGFLPEHQTDFIFSVVGETFGFVGGTAVIAAYLVIVLSILLIAIQADDLFGALICAGVATLTMAHVMINIGMCLGIMPIMGIPLPLLSQGGSSAVSFLVMIGLVLSVYRRRVKGF